MCRCGVWAFSLRILRCARCRWNGRARDRRALSTTKSPTPRHRNSVARGCGAAKTLSESRTTPSDGQTAHGRTDVAPGTWHGSHTLDETARSADADDGLRWTIRSPYGRTVGRTNGRTNGPDSVESAGLNYMSYFPLAWCVSTPYSFVPRVKTATEELCAWPGDCERSASIATLRPSRWRELCSRPRQLV